MDGLHYFLLGLGSRIRKARQDIALSQEQLAEKAGLHRTYIGMVERGEKNMTIGSYRRITHALGVHAHALLADAEAAANDIAHGKMRCDGKGSESEAPLMFRTEG